jgi:Fe-S-cluster containining protein
MASDETLPDCEQGQKMGCDNLCCRLFVVLTPDEVATGLIPQHAGTSMLRQERDGFCTHLDRQTRRCTVWHKRPGTCRLYNCNNDPKLQTVLREGFSSFGRAIEGAKEVARDEWIQVPMLKDRLTD